MAHEATRCRGSRIPLPPFEAARANTHPPAESLEQLPGRANYFGGNDPARWYTNAPTYARVKYHDVYPGVDLVYHGNQQRLEYDFIVQPGAKPDEILLEFAGAEKITLESNGDLRLQQQGDSVRQDRPVVYQEVDGVRRELTANYVLDTDMRVGFRVAEYDRTRPLIIDPVLAYATTFGGKAGQPFTGAFGLTTTSGFKGNPDFLTITEGSLPPELSLVSEAGANGGKTFRIQGTPSGPGTYHLTVHCTKGTCPYDGDITIEISVP